MSDCEACTGRNEAKTRDIEAKSRVDQMLTFGSDKQ